MGLHIYGLSIVLNGTGKGNRTRKKTIEHRDMPAASLKMYFLGNNNEQAPIPPRARKEKREKEKYVTISPTSIYISDPGISLKYY